MSGFKDLLVRRLLRERLGFRFQWMLRLEQDLGVPVPRPHADIPVTIRRIKKDGLSAFLSFVTPQLLPELERELRQGHLCVGVFHQDRALGYAWTNPHHIHEISTDLQFPLRPGEAYTYRRLIDPAFRNLGVGARLDWERNRILAAQGFCRRISYMGHGNHASRRSGSKAGNKPVGHLIFLQIFGRKFWLHWPMKKPGPAKPSPWAGQARDHGFVGQRISHERS